MKNQKKEKGLKIQKLLIGLCAVAALGSIFMLCQGARRQNPKLICISASALSALGLGMSVGGFLSNPYRKKERN